MPKTTGRLHIKGGNRRYWSVERRVRRLGQVQFAKRAESVVEAGADYIIEQARKNIDQKLSKGARFPGIWAPPRGSGRLLQSFDKRWLRRASPQTTGPKIEVGSYGTEYAITHEFGKVIRVKRAPYLRFTVWGRWYNRKSVVIPARPFLSPVIHGDFKGILEAMADEIRRRLATIAKG